LLGDTERIATALARGVCKAFNVAYDLPPVIQPDEPPVTPPVEPPVIPPVIEPPIISPETKKLETIKNIIWNKGWTWVKINKIKVLLPK
jgi:hypothetical protein